MLINFFTVFTGSWFGFIQIHFLIYLRKRVGWIHILNVWNIWNVL